MPVSSSTTGEWDDSVRQPCPICKEPRTLEMLVRRQEEIREEVREAAEREKLRAVVDALRKTAGGAATPGTKGLGQGIHTLEFDQPRAFSIDHGSVPPLIERAGIETCLACGVLYDPFAVMKAHYLADLVERERAKHPLQRLAHAANEDPLVEDLPPMPERREPPGSR